MQQQGATKRPAARQRGEAARAPPRSPFFAAALAAAGRGSSCLPGESRAAPFGVAGPEPPPAPKRHARLPNERERERRASRTRATTAPRRLPPLRLLPPRGGVAPRRLLGVALARRRRRLSARTRAGIKTVDERHVTRRSAVGRPRGSPLLPGESTAAPLWRRYRRQTSERARKRQSTSTSRRSARPAARLRGSTRHHTHRSTLSCLHHRPYRASTGSTGPLTHS